MFRTLKILSYLSNLIVNVKSHSIYEPTKEVCSGHDSRLASGGNKK